MTEQVPEGTQSAKSVEATLPPNWPTTTTEVVIRTGSEGESGTAERR